MALGHGHVFASANGCHSAEMQQCVQFCLSLCGHVICFLCEYVCRYLYIQMSSRINVIDRIEEVDVVTVTSPIGSWTAVLKP